MPRVQGLEEKPNQEKEQRLDTWVDQVKAFSSDGGKNKNNVGLFGEFTQSATVHGLKHTYGSGRSLFRRAFWCVAFLAMLGVLLYTIISQLMLLMTYPTISTQSIEFRASMPFPAVTLCNLNQVRASSVQDEATRQLMLGMSDIGSELKIDWDDPIWANFSEKTLEFREHFEFIAHPLDSTLTYCEWDNTKYPCRELFISRLTDFGLCYTFNGRQNVNSTQRMATHTGTKYGLTVVANIMQDEYLLSSSSDAAGLRVILHDFHETPLVEGRGFDVGPGFATKGSLTMKHMEFLPPPYKSPMGNECTNTSPEEFTNFLKLYDHYDMAACISECRYNYIYDNCSCLSVYDPGDQRICSAREVLECYVPTFEEFMKENIAQYCECPMQCAWNIYDAAVSSTYYPSKAMMEEVNTLFNISMDEYTFRRNFLKLTLAYDVFLLDSIEQVPQYSFETTMSALGGQLGVFLGASILSVVEFLEIGLAMLLCKLFNVKNKTPGKA